MELIMATLKIKCDCGKKISSRVGDRIYNNKLYWFQSYSCDNYGKTIEMEIWDKMPNNGLLNLIGKKFLNNW